MKRIYTSVFWLAFLLTSIWTSSARATSIVPVSATDSGWYRSDGVLLPDNTNYVVGRDADSPYKSYHDFFTFDLSSVHYTVLAATLSLHLPSSGYVSPHLTETVTFYDVSTPVAELRPAGANALTVFNDLGSGTVLGSVVVPWQQINIDRTIVITLNQAAIDSLNASLGQMWALGGALTTLDAVPGHYQYVFGVTGDGFDTRELTLTLVPEPGGWLLALVGLVALTFWRRTTTRKR